MATLEKTPSVTFAPKDVSEKTSSRTLRSNSTKASSRRSSKVGREIETPHGPVLRESVSNLRSGSSSSVPTKDDELVWPCSWRAYGTLLGCFLMMCLSWGQVNTFGTYLSFYAQHLLPEVSNASLSAIGGTQSFWILLVSPITGRLVDAAHVTKVLIVGVVLISISNFVQAFINGDAGKNDGNYALIWLVQGTVNALGGGCLFVTASKVVSGWFPGWRSTVIGIVASGASFGGTILPMEYKFLISSHGPILAQVYLATTITGLGIITVLLARPNPAQKVRKPEKWLAFETFFDRDAFRNKPFVWLCAAIALLFLGFYPIFFNLEEWAAMMGLGKKDKTPGAFMSVSIPGQKELDDDAIRTFWLTCILNGSSAVGRIGAGIIIDCCCDALIVHASVTFVAGLLVFCFWPLANTVPKAVAFDVLFGVFSGAVIGLPPASVASILGDHQQDKLGQWTGMMYVFAALPALVGPSIAGLMLTLTGYNFKTLQMWSGACFVLSAGCMGVAWFYSSRESAVPSMIAGHVATRSSGMDSTNVAEKETV